MRQNNKVWVEKISSLHWSLEAPDIQQTKAGAIKNVITSVLEKHKARFRSEDFPDWWSTDSSLRRTPSELRLVLTLRDAEPIELIGRKVFVFPGRYRRSANGIITSVRGYGSLRGIEVLFEDHQTRPFGCICVVSIKDVCLLSSG